jgi:hypothetical protein
MNFTMNIVSTVLQEAIDNNALSPEVILRQAG